MLTSYFVLLVTAACANAAIIPEELPSILSLVYSNIPPIKKGTDSRIGVGYRLGEHADFQIIFELGPQTETRPLGGNAPLTSKRNAATYNAQNKDKQEKSEGGKWLSKWAQQMKSKHAVSQVSTETTVPREEKAKPNEHIFISNDAIKQLESIYGKLPIDIPVVMPTKKQGDRTKENNTEQTK